MVAKTQAELLQEFRECVSRLRHMCEQYELGKHEFAPLIAVAIYQLVVEGRGRTRSLLLQLRRKDREFLATPLPPGPKRPGYTPLVRLSVKMSNRPGDAPVQRISPVYWCFDGFGYTPDSAPSPEVSTWDRKTWSDWWTETVLVHTEKARLSRKDIVCAMTDRLGGRHSDAEIDEAEADLIRDPGLTATVTGFGQTIDISMLGVHRPYVRQIAYELQRTLDETCSDLLNTPATVPPKVNLPAEMLTGDEEQRLAQLVAAGKGETGTAEQLRAIIYWRSKA